MFQLTEDWGEVLFSALSRAGGKAFSNMAVGYNNVDVNAANKYGVAVGNTPVSLFYSVNCYFLNLVLCYIYIFDSACSEIHIRIYISFISYLFREYLQKLQQNWQLHFLLQLQEG